MTKYTETKNISQTKTPTLVQFWFLAVATFAFGLWCGRYGYQIEIVMNQLLRLIFPDISLYSC